MSKLWAWLAKKLYKYLLPYLLPVVKQQILELDRNKHYLLFLPNSVLDDMTFDMLRKEFQPFVGDVNLMVLLTDEFHVIEF